MAREAFIPDGGLAQTLLRRDGKASRELRIELSSVGTGLMRETSKRCPLETIAT